MQVLTCGSNVTTSEHAIPADMRPGGVNLKIYIYIYVYICMCACLVINIQKYLRMYMYISRYIHIRTYTTSTYNILCTYIYTN